MEIGDSELVTKLKNADEQVFRQLVLQYQDKIFNTCISLVKNAEDADDLTQEVFIEIFRSIHKFREDSLLSTWIYRIAVNKSLEHLRRMKRKRRAGILTWFNKENREVSNDPADFNHPGVMAENEEQSRILFRAVEKLPESQKIAFTLHKLEGLSYEQIAAVMQKTLSSVESLMHRAKSNLKKELYEYYRSL
ncbi:MAG: RNA polymerase sigma factor [Cyclobacteriaceae bacterium]|jgi:RNA polymerase sigma-70 factor (ECF subfamily)